MKMISANTEAAKKHQKRSAAAAAAKKRAASVHVTDCKIFSTVKLMPGAETAGSVSLFIVPQGQLMPHLPSTGPLDYADVNKPVHTNLTQAGQFGSAIGDVSLDRLRAVLHGPGDAAPDAVAGTFELYVCGRKLGEWPLARLLAGPVSTELILVARTDTFEGRVTISSPIAAPVYLCVEFTGHAMKGTLESRRCPRCKGAGVLL